MNKLIRKMLSDADKLADDCQYMCAIKLRRVALEMMYG